jgi:hypothetical protein
VLSTSKPMVAGTSVRLPSISDSSATTNKWVWKLSPLGLRAACQLNIAKTICRSAPIRRGPQLTHECRSSHNHSCERTQVRQKITFEKHQVRILPQYRTALTVSPNARHRSAHLNPHQPTSCACSDHPWINSYTPNPESRIKLEKIPQFRGMSH